MIKSEEGDNLGGVGRNSRKNFKKTDNLFKWKYICSYYFRIYSLIIYVYTYISLFFTHFNSIEVFCRYTSIIYTYICIYSQILFTIQKFLYKEKIF